MPKIDDQLWSEFAKAYAKSIRNMAYVYVNYELALAVGGDPERGIKIKNQMRHLRVTWADIDEAMGRAGAVLKLSNPENLRRVEELLDVWEEEKKKGG